MSRSPIPAACFACLLFLGAPLAGFGQSEWESDEIALASSYEEEEEEEGSRPRRGFRFRNRDEDRWERPVQEPGEVTDIDSGFVCIDGKLLAAPYTVQWDGDRYTVNGNSIPMPTYDGYERIDGQELADELGAGAALWVDGPHSSVLGVGNGLFEFALVFSHRTQGTEVPHEAIDDFLNSVRHNGDASRFAEVWGGVEVPEDVATRIQTLVEQVEILESQAADVRNATTRLNSLAYPLTVFGMLMCVLAFGHLVAYPPFGFSAALVGPDSPIAQQAAVRSLALIAVLSCMDLLWTMLASNAGQMRELNPLGSRMITDPLHLIGFKFLGTGVGVALLFAIRRNHAAQVASWWMCMVLVLLAMRWIAFNSMFVA